MVCVVRMFRVRLGRWKESILVLSRVRGVMSYSSCAIGCAVMRFVGGFGEWYEPPLFPVLWDVLRGP